MGNNKTTKKTNRPEFPIFWTYLTDAKGVHTIHQVKFAHLIVLANNSYIDTKDRFGTTNVYFAAFEIAGEDGFFTNRKDLEGFKYHDLGRVYSTREKVEEEIMSIDGPSPSNTTKPSIEFKREFLTGGYISERCPINDCFFSWFNNLPKELDLYIDRTSYPAGVWWNGLFPVYEMAKVSYVGVNIGGLEPADDDFLNGRPLYDMVTNNWLGGWKHKYYKYLADCEKDNQTKVYEFA